MQEYGLSGTSSKHVDSPIPTPYTHVGQWDLSTPVICYPESSYISHWIIKNQLPVCRRSASRPPIPFQPYGHSNFLTLKSDYISPASVPSLGTSPCSSARTTSANYSTSVSLS